MEDYKLQILSLTNLINEYLSEHRPKGYIIAYYDDEDNTVILSKVKNGECLHSTFKATPDIMYDTLINMRDTLELIN